MSRLSLLLLQPAECKQSFKSSFILGNANTYSGKTLVQRLYPSYSSCYSFSVLATYLHYDGRSKSCTSRSEVGHFTTIKSLLSSDVISNRGCRSGRQAGLLARSSNIFPSKKVLYHPKGGSRGITRRRGAAHQLFRHRVPTRALRRELGPHCCGLYSSAPLVLAHKISPSLGSLSDRCLHHLPRPPDLHDE